MENMLCETSFGAVLSLREAATRCGVSVWHFREMCRRGEIGSIKIGSGRGQRGGRRLIPESEINAWIQRNLQAG